MKIKLFCPGGDLSFGSGHRVPHSYRRLCAALSLLASAACSVESKEGESLPMLVKNQSTALVSRPRLTPTIVPGGIGGKLIRVEAELF